MQIGVKLGGRKLTWEEAFADAEDPLRDSVYPADFLNEMRVDYTDPDREPGVESFTPTRVMGCHRQAALMEHHDYYVDADQAYPMLRGQMVHALMERARYPGALASMREKRMRLVVDLGPEDGGEQVFTAKPDLVVVKRLESLVREGVWKEGTDEEMTVYHEPFQRAVFKIVDYKSTGEIKHELTSAKFEHELQVNMYAYLVSRNALVYDDHGVCLGTFTRAMGLPDDVELVCDEVEIVYCDMKRVRRFTSKGWLKDRGKRTNRSAPYTYETLDLEPLRLWTPSKVGDFIRKRIAERLRARVTLPPMLPVERQWLCNYCPVAELCFALQAQGFTGATADADPGEGDPA